MVKHDPPVIATSDEDTVLKSTVEKPAETPADMLRRAGMDLLKSQRLVQMGAVGPLQLHNPGRALDNVLVSPGRPVAVLTDKHGRAALEYAAERPHWQIHGWLPDTRSWLDLQRVELPENVLFDKQPQSIPKKSDLPQAILAVAWAHRVFSQRQYNVAALGRAVKNLLDLLPDNGQLLIQDFALPEDHDRFVVLELEDDEAIEALEAFSATARAYAPKALRGFFIEPLYMDRPGTQRFRLPMKWAVEFYHRWRLGIAVEAPFELTTLSLSQWVGLIEQCGARATYRAPHYLSAIESADMRRDVRFYDENDQGMGLPASSFTLLVEKIAVEEPVHFYERRISGDKAQDITISGLRNTKTDDRRDMVEITRHEDDVLPWYQDASGELHVLVCTDVARPIINSVPRGTANLDGRQWAGYLVEPLTIPHLPGNLSTEFAVTETQKALGLPQSFFGVPQNGIEYYPAPEYLLQRVRGILMPLRADTVPLPEMLTPRGRVIDVRAIDVLRAISGGLIPDGKLEILIGKLMLDLGLTPPAIAGGFAEFERKVKTVKDRREAKMPRVVQSGEHLMEYIDDNPTENLRAVRSVFAEDQITAQGRHVARYNEQDFIVAARHSSNTAVVIPFLRDPMGALMISAEPRRLPVPHRMGTGNEMAHLVGFSLPNAVRSVDDARFFLAEQLACSIGDLYELGPSFFVQPQLSFERVYPFLLYAPTRATTQTRWFKPRGRLQHLVSPHIEKTEAYMEFSASRNLGPFYQGFGPDMQPVVTKAPAPATQGDLPFAPQSGIDKPQPA